MALTKKLLSQRRPWSSGEDDKYVCRFIKRSLRMAIKRGKTVEQWFDALPKNLQQPLYFAGAYRCVYGLPPIR